MTILRNVRWLAALLLVFLVTVSLERGSPALAQDAPPKLEKQAPLAPSLPRTPDERDTVLADLYAQLADAEDETASKAVEESIERVWAHSGSPTVDLLFGRAMQAVSEKSYDRALRFLDNVVEQAPDFTEGWNRRAFVHFQLNSVGLALGDLRRALALDPSNYKALDGLGQVLRDIGEKRGALEVMRKLAAVHPNWPGTEQAIEELSREVDGQGI